MRTQNKAVSFASRKKNRQRSELSSLAQATSLGRWEVVASGMGSVRLGRQKLDVIMFVLPIERRDALRRRRRRVGGHLNCEILKMLWFDLRGRA